MIITSNLICYKKNKLLLVKRADCESEFGLWSLPGGTAEEGESIYHCLKREIKEELDVLVYNPELVDIIHGEKNIAYYFIGEITGNIKLNYELSEYKWFKLKDLPPMAYNQHKLFITG